MIKTDTPLPLTIADLAKAIDIPLEMLINSPVLGMVRIALVENNMAEKIRTLGCDMGNGIQNYIASTEYHVEFTMTKFHEPQFYERHDTI